MLVQQTAETHKIGQFKEVVRCYYTIFLELTKEYNMTHKVNDVYDTSDWSSCYNPNGLLGAVEEPNNPPTLIKLTILTSNPGFLFNILIRLYEIRIIFSDVSVRSRRVSSCHG